MLSSFTSVQVGPKSPELFGKPNRRRMGDMGRTLNAEERSPSLFTLRIPLPSSGTNRSFPPGESASARLNQDRANATHPAAPVFDRDQTRKSLQDNPFQQFTQPLSSSASHPEHHRIKEPSLYESARPPLPPVPTRTSSRDSASNWPNIKHNSTHSDREIPGNPRVNPGNEDDDGNLRTSFDKQFGASEAHGEVNQQRGSAPEESFPQQKNDKWSPQQIGKFPRRVDRSTSTFSRSGQYSKFAGDTSFTHPASGLEASQEHSYSQEIPPFEANVSPSTRGTPPLDSPSRVSQPEHQESHVVSDAPPHLTVPHKFYHFPPYSSLADKHTSQPSDLPPEEPSPDHSSEEISAYGHAAHQSDLSAAQRDTQRKFVFNPDSIAPRTASSSDNTTVATGVFASSTDPFGTAETRLAPPQLHLVNFLGKQASAPVGQLMEPQPDVTTLLFESYDVNPHSPDRSTSADNSSKSSVSRRNQGHTEPFNVSTKYSSGSESQEAVGTYNEGPSTEKFPWTASRNPPEMSEQTNISGPLGREPPVNPNILVATEKEDPPKASFFRRSPYTINKALPCLSLQN
ncbi:hypothetical protein PCANC_13843 [Puccinia coronata f. sp. avenae]|uniref:Uncharacterized protein n=1 Tax=Puccinia coronata f. sp. avenae TaxID=200324 RepID=A0A2N5UD41_9BASI|nr:hypothetical protein PCANC_13843 [Puccinia coronata f. sp. avenae]